MRVRHLFLLAGLAACATTPTAPELAPTGPVVSALRVRGNDALPDKAIEAAIATRATNRFLFFGSVHRLDTGSLAQDARRIRDLYEEHGFYAARVEPRVHPVGEDEVEVEILVEEGPPTIVRTLLVEGLEDLSARRRAEVLADPPLRVGDRFVEADWIAWKEAVRERLREAGHARAAVEGRVEVAPEEGVADLILVANPGEAWRFGEVAVVGNQLVPADRIRAAASVVLAPGDRYAPSAMADAQAEVFELGAFSAVTVTDRVGAPAEEPAAAVGGGAPAPAAGAGEVDAREPSDGAAPRTPVVIAVNEADFLRLRLGAGVGLDQSYYQARVLGEVTHLNVFGGLQKLQWSNELAYRFINPGADLAGESGPAAASRLSFTQPDFVTTRVDLLALVEYERTLRPAYAAQSASGRIGLPIRIRRGMHLVPSYNVTRFFDVSVFREDEVDPVVPGVRPSLVGDCPAGCTLSWLEQVLVVDRRDDPLEPRRGWYGSLGLQEGGLGGDFAWLRFVPQVRGYLPLSDEIVLAGRLELGYLEPLSACEGEQARDPYLAAVDCSPIVVRFFGGGADGFRGVGADRLSPLRAVDEDGRRRFIPLGGNASLLATGELRWYFSETWSSAFFLDAGNVAQTAALAFAPENLQLALGAGVRLRTPIGPVRLDVGHRFLREPLVPIGGGPPPEQNTLDYFALFLSIGEAF